MMAGMDSQFIANLISGISTLAAIASAIFAGRQAISSKEAKAEAEERARHAEELLKQMQQLVTEQQSQSQSQADIASNLWRPKFQLTHVRGLRYKLHNITKQSLNVIKVVNQDEFFRCDDIHQQFNPGESLDVLLGGVMGKPLPSNLILQIEGHNEPIYIQIPGESD